MFISVTSAKPIDERVTRYIDRSDVFEGAAIADKSSDGLKLTISAGVEKKYFYFGTDNSGRDLLTRTLIAGRLPNTPDNLRRWLVDPQGVKPHSAMPASGVGEADALAIAAYLARLH